MALTEQICNSNAQLFSCIPVAHEERHCWEKTTLKEAQKDAHADQPSKISNEASA